MSLFGKLFRGAAVTACVALTGAANAQQPSPPAILDLPGQEPVTPASGFGRAARPAPCPSPYYPCPPAVANPATGLPANPPATSDPPAPSIPSAAQTPDFGALTGGAGVGPTVGLNGYIENAAPVTMARLRFDSGYGNNRPDRGEFFYAKCGCFRPQPGSNGVPLPERNVDYQELTESIEVAVTQRFSAFVNLPQRFINPDLNRNAAGLGDVSFGGKYAFVYNQNRILSFMLRFQAPSGSLSNGLGNGNWWVEPGLLYLEQVSQKMQVFGEFRFQAPLGVRSDFTGNLLRYGIGTSYVVAQGCWGYVAPVVELVGWTVLSGKELNPDQLAAVGAHGDTIVNAKFGVRIGLGSPTPGTPYPTRSDLYIGYGRALTGEVWYKDLLRVEYRLFF